MNKTEKQIRLCMRIMHKLIRRWYEEQGITRGSGPYGPRCGGSMYLNYTSLGRYYICSSCGLYRG